MDRVKLYLSESVTLYGPTTYFMGGLLPDMLDLRYAYDVDNAIAQQYHRILLLDKPRCMLVAIGDPRTILSVEWVKKQIEKLKESGDDIQQV